VVQLRWYPGCRLKHIVLQLAARIPQILILIRVQYITKSNITTDRNCISQNADTEITRVLADE